MTSLAQALPLLAIGLAAAMIGAGAPAVGAQAAHEDVAGICEHVLGLMPGERHYAACVDSLAGARANLALSARNSAARRDCLARGLQPGTPALAECVLSGSAGELTPPLGPPGEAPIPGGRRSYFQISRATAAARDQLACARLGFDPTQDGFGACVADLRSALARASEPSM